ncbi:hypothetical protein EON68_03990 [archaeon]|nr:MAG: hypothetical protein EON68_03990 [archaeon]
MSPFQHDVCSFFGAPHAAVAETQTQGTGIARPAARRQQPIGSVERQDCTPCREPAPRHRAAPRRRTAHMAVLPMAVIRLVRVPPSS